MKLQQRWCELQSLATSPGERQQVCGVWKCGSVELQQFSVGESLHPPPPPLQVVLPHDGSCEDIDEAEMAQIRALGFLDW